MAPKDTAVVSVLHRLPMLPVPAVWNVMGDPAFLMLVYICVYCPACGGSRSELFSSTHNEPSVARQ